MATNDEGSKMEHRQIADYSRAEKIVKRRQWSCQSPDKVMVAVACCLSAAVSMGIALSLGTVYLDVMDTFHTSRPLAALLQSLTIGIAYGGGILTGPIMGQAGGAITTIAGSLLCCTGCIAGSLAPSDYVLIVCFGILTGAGVSCIYLGAHVVMRTAFQNNRRLALPAVTVCSGIGCTVFPPLIRWLVDQYTLRGMFLILGAIYLQCFLSGVIYARFGPVTNLTRKAFEKSLSDQREDWKDELHTSRREVWVKDSDCGLSLPENDKNSANETSAQLNTKKGSLTCSEMKMDVKEEPESRRPRNVYWSMGEKGSQTVTRSTLRRSTVSVTFQTDLIHNRRYVLVTMSCCVVFLTFTSSAMFLPDIVKEGGLTVDQATQLLSILFGCNVLGRGLVVALQVCRHFPALLAYGLAIFCYCLANFGYSLVDFIEDDVLTAYTAVCGVSGLFMGLVITLGPLTCAELVEVTHYAPALGYQMFIIGLCISFGGPLGGWLKVKTGSYNAVFYILLAQGTIALVVIVVLTVSPFHHRHRQRSSGTCSTVTAINTTVNPLSDDTSAYVHPLSDDVSATVNPLSDGISATVIPLLDDISATVNHLPDDISATVNHLPDDISATVNHLSDNMSATINPSSDDMPPTAKLLPDDISATVNPLSDDISATVNPLSDDISATVNLLSDD